MFNASNLIQFTGMKDYNKYISCCFCMAMAKLYLKLHRECPCAKTGGLDQMVNGGYIIRNSGKHILATNKTCLHIPKYLIKVCLNMSCSLSRLRSSESVVTFHVHKSKTIFVQTIPEGQSK